MSGKLPELSRGEWLVMNICWSKGACTARHVYEEAVKKKQWEYQTVKTMLDRLASKGYLRSEKFGPLCVFQPIAARAKVVTNAVDVFVDNVLDNTFAPLFENLARRGKLDDAEIRALRKLLEEQEEH